MTVFYTLSNHHLNDNSKIDSSQSDKILKIRSLVQRLNHLFVRKHSPSEHVSVDESVIRFKGRNSLKQYNPMKPIRREYKLWCVVNNNDGYVYKFEVYVGKIFRKGAPLKILV